MIGNHLGNKSLRRELTEARAENKRLRDQVGSYQEGADNAAISFVRCGIELAAAHAAIRSFLKWENEEDRHGPGFEAEWFDQTEKLAAVLPEAAQAAESAHD